MHVVFRESHGLEETATPVDLQQSPADLVVLSFSDSDLGAFAEGWRRGTAMPSLRLANLAALQHPLSVDTYVEQTLSGASGILVRLIGGMPYWSYGLQQVRALAEARGIALAVLPADGREDPQLDAVSTLPVSTLRRLAHHCDTGGAVAAQAALAQLALASGLYMPPVSGAKAVPPIGAWSASEGLCCPFDLAPDPAARRIVITFYRSYMVAADLAPIAALEEAFRDLGYAVTCLFVPSLKAPEAAAWLGRHVAHLRPAAIVNATAFSGKGNDGTSPLDIADVPVFQVAFATSTRETWSEAERGLSPADLAMHVVLPEVDGRIFAGVASFKEPSVRDPDLQFAHVAHQPHPERIAAIARRVDAWLQPLHERSVAVVLSTYPGKAWNMAHAVGLDALASAEAILDDLGAPADLGALSCARLTWPLADYKAALAKLPDVLQRDLYRAWGVPEEDPAIHGDVVTFTALRSGSALVAVQPERAGFETRSDDYHDLARVPRHSYVAFYLWLQSQCSATIHVGAHGTLEWLPGKSVALSDACWPEVLTGSMPVIYPFIVNDPGEAAQAKRRIGAVTLGHVPPPLRKSATPDRFVRLEALLDEFSNADGLDPARRARLQDDIRGEASALGLEADLGLRQDLCPAEAITRIDRFVCDVKDSQFGDGLHIWGQAPGEREGLRRALAGQRVPPGPSGSPYRGRTDVLPTGRNLFSTDPRSVPTQSAYVQGVRLADELVRRHLQDEGDWPRGLVVDLWGSATMRTAGEEFAMALNLIGARPVWDAGSARVSGIEIIPITELDRPRIDVTLRVSGLFRDVFPSLTAMFNQAIRVLAARDEAADWNPYVGRSDLRVYGPAPGSFGLGMPQDASRTEAGEAWLSASAWAHDGDTVVHDEAGLRRRIAAADSFVHLQDLSETDLLLAADYAAHEAGFAAAQSLVGGAAQLYHLDSSNPDRPGARRLDEEISRVVHARASNPDWIAGMRRHGFRGGAEIAATLDHMAAFAELASVVGPHLFDMYFDATLGDPETEAFLAEANPGALEAMRYRFAKLAETGLWNTRRNSIRARMEAAE